MCSDCDAYAHKPSSQRTKAEAKGKKCVFVGYSDHHKGYELFEKDIQKVTVHRDVIFNEEAFGNRDPSEAFSESEYEKEDVNNKNYECEFQEANESDEDEPVDIPAYENEPNAEEHDPEEKIDYNEDDIELQREDIPYPSLIIEGPRLKHPVTRYGDMVHHNWARSATIKYMQEQAELSTATSSTIPKSWEDAIEGDDKELWLQAGADELQYSYEAQNLD